MTGSFSQWVPYFPWLVGCSFVLLALGIVLRRESRRYLRDSELLKIVSELTATWRIKTRGYARALALIAVCLFAVGMVVLAVFSRRLEEFPVVEMHNVEVIEAVGNFSYWFRDESGNRRFATFCDTLGYPPPFDRGETILLLKFKNRGTCWDMHDVHPKYVMLRDKDGDPILKEN